jgi:hypothetical protein
MWSNPPIGVRWRRTSENCLGVSPPIMLWAYRPPHWLASRPEADTAVVSHLRQQALIKLNLTGLERLRE